MSIILKNGTIRCDIFVIEYFDFTLEIIILKNQNQNKNVMVFKGNIK